MFEPIAGIAIVVVMVGAFLYFGWEKKESVEPDKEEEES